MVRMRLLQLLNGQLGMFLEHCNRGAADSPAQAKNKEAQMDLPAVLKYSKTNRLASALERKAFVVQTIQHLHMFS